MIELIGTSLNLIRTVLVAFAIGVPKNPPASAVENGKDIYVEFVRSPCQFKIGKELVSLLNG